MSSHVGSTSWGRSDHDSTTGSGSLRASRLGARHSTFRSDRSFHDARFHDQRSPRASREQSESGYKRRRRSKAPLTARVSADAQTNRTLDSSLVALSFTRNGQEAGINQTASIVSPNNFINFCATLDTPITDGKQLLGGSCNPAPLGEIPSIANLPSVRISAPTNGLTLAANTSIPLSLAVRNLKTGVFVNPQANYLSAPQQLDSTGNILGHYHVVVEELDALNSTVPADNRNFVFFSILGDPAGDAGTIESTITDGLPEGFYRISVMVRAANHQPVLVPIAQHGFLNDAAYFTVTASGSPGSTPSIWRRAPIPGKIYQRQPSSKTPRQVIPRADIAAQSSFTLLPSVLAPGFSSDGSKERFGTGQSPSLTSTNNYINFCATTTLPITDGTQVQSGFCNPAPMGALPASTQMPSSKFTYPRNGDVLAPNAPMTVGLAVTNFAAGNFANAETTYLSGPQQLDVNGRIQGHPSIVFERLTTPDQTQPVDPTLFSLFKGITGVADSTGVITATVSGLQAGFYRLSSIIVTTNGQPVLLPVLEHGAVDDTIYFTVVEGGALPTNHTALPEVSQTPQPQALPPSPGFPVRPNRPPLHWRKITSEPLSAVLWRESP
ncbi:hypothetical protein DFH09DRAFT_170041 [Mycena vulgaris]|nr:hypothetical protein DFH09DRAFT_170041 [Mycena vulgaris]